MCGYVRRKGPKSELMAHLKKFGLEEAWQNTELDFTDLEEGLQQFYPAFGGAAGRQIKALIIQEEGKLKAVNATWWFQCEEHDGHLVVDNRRTTFNARNLESPYWKGAIRHHRGIVVATGLGEGKLIGKTNHHYLMEANEPFFMGAVYRTFPNNLYSCAIITRDAHPRFDAYHDKAFPMFLPNDREALQLWLSDEPETHPGIAHILQNPGLHNDLTVTRVKTFKGGVPMDDSQLLVADSKVA